MTVSRPDALTPPAAGGEWPIAPLAESALLVQMGDRIDEALVGRVLALADAIDAAELHGVVDVVPSYTTLMVVFDPERADGDALAAAIRNLAVTTSTQAPAGRVRAIPVAYGGELGPDLEDVAARAGMTPDEVVRRHSGARYRVACMGFAPGFGYLLGLPPELAMPRRATPRARVPAGSVALGGDQAAVYPLTTPGGWHVLGRTPLKLFDLAAPEPIFLQPGDEVRFEPIDRATYDRLDAEQADSPSSRETPATGVRAIEIVKPGALDSVQDLGRPGRMRSGVTPGGACDRAALILGNRLVGNSPDAAGIESTLVGPTLRFHADAVVALTGADAGARLNGRPALNWEPFAVREGDELALGAMRDGARTYLCVAGGIDAPIVLGGRGTDLFGKFGGWQGRALAAGDRLPLGEPLAPAADLLRRRLVAPLVRDSATPVRVVLGPQRDRFTEEGIATLLGAPYAVTPQSDRMGLRLRGPALEHRDGADLISEGIAAGAIQAPGDGQPIVLLPARQTVGGYPKIATVIGADLDRLGQARPGDTLRFAAVDLADARLALLAARAALGPEAVTERARPVSGWSPDDAPEPERNDSVTDAARAWTPTGIADLLERARRSGAVSLDLDIAPIGVHLQARWQAAGLEAAPSMGETGEAAAPGGEIIPAPVLGIFYRRSEPAGPPLAEEGRPVRAGQTIAVLEVMKTYHEVVAPRDGVLARFLVEDGAFVEYGQPLARLTRG